MNIMQYRALKAQESASAPTPAPAPQATPPSPNPTPAVQTTPAETKPTETTKPAEIKIPDKITIDGIGEVTFDELKNGYLRQSDYTQKTQEVARQRKEAQDAVAFYESVKQNPQVLQTLKQTTPVPPNLDPATARVMELENKVFDMMLQNEISTLTAKYPDFEVREVLSMAQKKQMTNLEDAYHLVKSAKSQPVDSEAIKAQLRKEILKELQSESTATQTIITPGAVQPVIPDNSPKLSDAERNVAMKMRLSDADYVKWRDAGRNKK